MADEAGEVNTAVTERDEKQEQDEPKVLRPATNGEPDGGSEQDWTERQAPQVAEENSWSAPLLSLARKATETISSGISYAAIQRKPSQGSAASSPTENEAESDLSNSAKKLPGRLWFF